MRRREEAWRGWSCSRTGKQQRRGQGHGRAYQTVERTVRSTAVVEPEMRRAVLRPGGIDCKGQMQSTARGVGAVSALRAGDTRKGGGRMGVDEQVLRGRPCTVRQCAGPVGAVAGCSSVLEAGRVGHVARDRASQCATRRARLSTAAPDAQQAQHGVATGPPRARRRSSACNLTSSGIASRRRRGAVNALLAQRYIDASACHNPSSLLASRHSCLPPLSLRVQVATRSTLCPAQHSRPATAQQSARYSLRPIRPRLLPPRAVQLRLNLLAWLRPQAAVATPTPPRRRLPAPLRFPPPRPSWTHPCLCRLRTSSAWRRTTALPRSV